MSATQTHWAYLKLIEADIRRIVRTPLPAQTSQRIDVLIEFCTLHCNYSSEAKLYLEHLPPNSRERLDRRRQFEATIASFDAFERLVGEELAVLEQLLPEAPIKKA
jgi:hypothetical protein